MPVQLCSFLGTEFTAEMTTYNCNILSQNKVITLQHHQTVIKLT